MKASTFFFSLLLLLSEGCSTAVKNQPQTFEDFLKIYSESENKNSDEDLRRVLSGLSLPEQLRWGKEAIKAGVNLNKQRVQRIALVASQTIESSISSEEKAAFARSHDIFGPDFQLAEIKKGKRKIFVTDPAFWFSTLNIHDALVDVVVGLKPESLKAEETLLDKKLFGQENVGLGVGRGVLNTSYAQFEAIIRVTKPKPGATFVDIGAGDGRLGFLIGLKYPRLAFKGYEIVPTRVTSSKKAAGFLKLPPSVEFIEQDLSDPRFSLPEAEFFYMFNPVSSATRQKIWADLKKVAGKRPITLITLLMKPEEIPSWLKPVAEIDFGRKDNILIWKN